jgi:predicted amidohydrolase YtcJ
LDAKLYVNGNVHTLDQQTPHGEGIYVENGKVVAVGSSDDLKIQYARHGVSIEDLEGATVLPGWVDSHLHLPMQGMKLSALDFSNVTSKQEMLHLLKERVGNTVPGEWILGLNWNENQFPDAAIPTIEELTAITPQNPIFLTRTCYHCYVANRMAFQLANVGEGTNDPEGGSFGRGTSGKLNGLIYEHASKPFFEAQPQPTYEMLKDHVRKAAKHALSLGLTAVHTEDIRYLGSIDQMRRIYRELLDEGVLLRTHHLIYYKYMDELSELGLTAGSGDDWFRIGSVKIFADGAIGGRTALLSKPYHDAPNTIGIAMHSDEELGDITRRARKLGMPIAVHAIGDGAAERLINVMEAYPVQSATRYRDRFIHAQIMRADLVERLKKLQVAIDIQPRFVASDFPWVMERVGPERLDYAYAWKKLMDAGLHCAGGSDAPIEPLDPRLGFHAAMTRRKPSERHEGYLPEEKLTMDEAIRLFTIGSALAATEEMERGTLASGKYADFTVVDRDPYEMEPDELLELQVKMTVINGKIGFRI